MITYKNITDVEVLESVPENAMTLVNDGGELKQVACKKFSKEEIPTVIASYDGNNFSIDMPFDELWSILMEGKPIFAFINYSAYPKAILPAIISSNNVGKILFCSSMDLTANSYSYSLFCCYWPDGTITSYDPNSAA